MSNTSPEVLSAPYTLQYAYKRALGPVIGRFLTGLRDGQILGVRTSDGRVMVPPAEYDPQSSEALSDFVTVGETGDVVSWCWVAQPRRGQPLDRPFGFALIKLDGADTPMLHAVDAGESTKMSTGMRVRVRWQQERVGRIEDIACFEPVDAEESAP